MTWDPRSRLLADPATDHSEWTASPPVDAAVQAAWEYFSAALSGILRRANVSADDLAGALGATASSWRHKMNGTRMWQIDDALGIVLAFGLPLPEPLWNPQAENADVLPPAYRGLVRPRGYGLVPTLEREVRWQDAFQDLSTWIAEVGTGGLSSTVVLPTGVDRLVAALDRCGLPRGLALVDVDWPTNSTQAHLTWPSRGTAVWVTWSAPFEAPSGARTHLTNIMNALFSADPREALTTVVVLVAHDAVTAAVRDVLLNAPGGVLSYEWAKRDGLVDGSGAGNPSLELELSEPWVSVLRIR